MEFDAKVKASGNPEGPRLCICSIRELRAASQKRKERKKTLDLNRTINNQHRGLIDEFGHDDKSKQARQDMLCMDVAHNGRSVTGLDMILTLILIPTVRLTRQDR